MSLKKALRIGIAALIAFIVLFEIRFEFSLPGERRQADPEQEARYTACYAERDRQIHESAFTTIDNPDVQKLYISNNRAIAAYECRVQFPQQWLVVDEPLRIRLKEIRFRFRLDRP